MGGGINEFLFNLALMILMGSLDAHEVEISIVSWTLTLVSLVVDCGAVEGVLEVFWD